MSLREESGLAWTRDFPWCTALRNKLRRYSECRFMGRWMHERGRAKPRAMESFHRRYPPAIGAGGGVRPLSLRLSFSLSFFFVFTLLSSVLDRLCVTLLGSFTAVPPNLGCMTATSLSSGKLSSTKLKK